MSSTGFLRDRPRVGRQQAARMLGCTMENVRYLERRGKLPSRALNRRGEWTFDRAEVEILAHERSGRAAQLPGATILLVFSMFRDGRTLDEIVVATGGLHPDAINDLFRKFEHGLVVEDPDKRREREAREAREARERREREEDRERERMNEIEAAIVAMVERTSPTRPSVAKVSSDVDPTRADAERVIAKGKEYLRRFGGGGRGQRGDGEGNAAE